MIPFSKTEIDDMIRKPTNLLLTKTLKSALVDLTAAESESRLSFSQVNFLRFEFLNIIEVLFVSLFKFVSIHYI